jgi:hypothetical protein
MLTHLALGRPCSALCELEPRLCKYRQEAAASLYVWDRSAGTRAKPMSIHLMLTLLSTRTIGAGDAMSTILGGRMKAADIGAALN